MTWFEAEESEEIALKSGDTCLGCSQASRKSKSARVW